MLNTKEQITAKNWKKIFKENIFFFLKVFILSLLVVNFIGRVSIVKGSSMEPGIHTNERILVNLLVYRFGYPSRGDIIVFRYPRNPSREYIKRVVGVSGDKIAIKNGLVFINGNMLQEVYIDRQDHGNMMEKVVPENHLFVMGDNRINSEDSRVFGFLPVSNVRGQAFFVFWPPDRLRLLK